jgi:hypothetical protein
MRRLLLVSTRSLLLLLFLLTACGGGGGGGGSAAAPQSTTALVTLKTAVTGPIPAGTTINGYDVTIELPAGVTVRSSLATHETESGVVVASGAATGSSIAAVYTSAVGTTPGKVRILIANASVSGISEGEFSKVTCDVAAGLKLGSSHFASTDFVASGFDAASKTNVDLTSVMTLTATVAIP